MYSVILMTAMAASAPDAAQFGLRAGRGCVGCTGCAGSCYGYSYGYACRGGCSGCYGSGYGYSSCSGCYGSCHGCYGSSYYGSSYYSNPYYGDAPIRSAGHAGWWGMTEYYPPTYGPAVWGADYNYSGRTPYIQTTPQELLKKAETDKSLEGTARIVIDVPAEAKLTIDGNVMKSTSGQRLFYTPKLNEGQAYYYDVAVEVPGEKAVTRRVYVHANEIVRETFPAPGSAAGLANK